MEIVYTYTPDMTRPMCPDCGAIVNQETDTPEIEWVGVCHNGHKNIFQLDTDEWSEFD